jgi:hypothetical protein
MGLFFKAKRNYKEPSKVYHTTNSSQFDMFQIMKLLKKQKSYSFVGWALVSLGFLDAITMMFTVCKIGNVKTCLQMYNL